MFDELLLGMAQRHNGIEHLMESIFSFFERRTDLFHVMLKDDDKMGFPPGIAEKMVLNQFKKQKRRYYERTRPSSDRGYEDVLGDPPAGKGSGKGYPEAVGAAGAGAGAGGGARAASSSDTGASSDTAEPQAKEEKKPPEPGTIQERFQHISTWNGAVCKDYRWSQSLQEVTVEIPVPKCKARDLQVDIQPTKISIKCRGEKVLSGDLDEKVFANEDSTWSLEDGCKVVLSLDKVRHTWWKCFLQGDQEIDTTKVESTKRVDEYDPETQGAIRKIMFDQSQKAKGDATSDQIRTADVMKKAWNAENSPFRGTEYDPSLLNLQGNIGQEFFEKMDQARTQEAIRKKEAEKRGVPLPNPNESGSSGASSSNACQESPQDADAGARDAAGGVD